MKLIRFKKFIAEELKASKRVGIEHISSLKPIEFINLCKYFQQDLKGIISSASTQINLKMDGCGLRIGLDQNQNFFIESSNSGPQTKIGAFADYTTQKFGSSNPISDSYDDVLKKLKEHSTLQSYLKKNFPNGVKLFCELLYTPNAKKINDKLQFLVVKYDSKKLGKVFSLVFYKTEDLDGNKLKNEKQVFADLKKLSTHDILFDDQQIDYEDINIKYEVDSFLELLNDYSDIENVLKSRKAVDQPTKEALMQIISKFQKEISNKIISTKFNNKFGDEFEGLVLYFGNGKVVKVVTQDYKSGKQEFNKEYKK